MKTNLTLVLVVLTLSVLLLQLTDGASVKKEKKPKKRPPLPDGMSIEDVIMRKGFKKKDRELQYSILCNYTGTVAELYDREVDVTQSCDKGFDIVFTIDQALHLKNNANKKLKEKKDKEKKDKEEKKGKDVAKTRSKRYIIDFTHYPNSKWPTDKPIYYYFHNEDGLSEEEVEERERIKDKANMAFLHWEERTCLKFILWDEDKAPKNLDQYIYITFNNTENCYSNIGRIPSKYQQKINIASHCSPLFGTMVHEIGHTLGLYHAHARIDRNLYIDVRTDNIETSALAQYQMATLTTTAGVAYDFASSMHYSGLSNFAINKAEPVIVARDHTYQRSMGIRAEMSFYDSKIINLEYCESECSHMECERGGIPNPNDCTTCMCPPGFAGANCEKVASGTGACRPFDSKSIMVTNTNYEYVYTVGFDAQDPMYPSNAKCNFYLQAPEGCRIALTFDPEFSLFCEGGVCNHWVEIKSKDGLRKPGPRFCCSGQQTFGNNSHVLVSEGREVLVSFDSTMIMDDDNGPDHYFGGFKLGYKLNDASCQGNK